MLIAGFPAGVFATNCYVVAPGPGERCVVVDPGQAAMPALAQTLREHNLRPAAVLLTHGHVDHTWSVAPVCGAHDIPAFIHPRDRAQLSDPLSAVSPEFAAVLKSETFTEPADVRELADGQSLGFFAPLGLEFAVDHAPGHTGGSVTFRLARGTGEPDLLFSGDVLFAGSIGRTDLPGGDHAAMLASLDRVILPLPDETVVLPGHGPQTTIGRERAANPYLQGLKSPEGKRPGL